MPGEGDDEGGRREGKYDVAALLSRDAISGTLTRHYLSMIGMLSAHSRGLKIMRDFSMWSMLQPLVQQAMEVLNTNWRDRNTIPSPTLYPHQVWPL